MKSVRSKAALVAGLVGLMSGWSEVVEAPLSMRVPQHYVGPKPQGHEAWRERRAKKRKMKKRSKK